MHLNWYNMNFPASSTQVMDDTPKSDLRNYILDPMSTIIKLSILANKPVGTKICIQNNTVVFQEPGPFQAFCRVLYQSNKSDIQYLYNPIQIACTSFLVKDKPSDGEKHKDGSKKHGRIRSLFLSAQKGLERLSETYRCCSVIKLCLNYYHAIISNYVDDYYNETLFRKDGLSLFYTEPLIKSLGEKWTPERMKVVLDIIGFLNHEASLAENNVRSLETIMLSIDSETRETLSKI